MYEQIRTAIRIRKGLIPSNTNAYRIFDGISDGHEGIFIDVFNGHWLVSYREEEPEPLWFEGHEAESIWFKAIEQEDKGAARCVRGDPDMSRVVIMENGVSFEVDFAAGYSQGLFLDQRLNRLEVAGRASGKKILNCFSYTCGFSVAAAVAGAQSTTSIDLSRSYLEWGKRNFSINDISLSSSNHHFCRGDVFEWLNQFRRKERSFDGVILDPPSFSRSKKGGVFTIERDYPRLVAAASRLVGKGGWILACCNHHGINEGKFKSLISEGMLKSESVVVLDESLQMPPDFSGQPYLKSIFLEF
ncbi:MAG: class I SAM-dependent rRNA methyltransferase [Verrucomicrobiaceae bacterium]|nr:class I SAM-dependent rRNA methyltransferase [Verrucomicrobiaceae bacterium]